MSASTFVCALSGVVPSEPVVARSSGVLFERRLVERALELSGGVCPVTKQPLSKDDLIALRPSLAPAADAPVPAGSIVRARPPSATSVPGLLALLQGEWDALVLESFALRQALESAKQDLALALYKEDAAQRVIARLLQERDAARAQLLQTQQNVAAAPKSAPAAPPAAAPMDVDDGAQKKGASAAGAVGELPESVLSLLTSTASSLSKTRKATIKEAAASAAQPGDLAQWRAQSNSCTLHSTTNPGILCVDVSRGGLGDLLLTGGNDGAALVFNKATGKIQSSLKAHKSAVSSVRFHPTREDVLFSASVDQSALVWRAEGQGLVKYGVAHSLTGARDAITSLGVHISGELVSTSSKDGSWALYDVNVGSELKRVGGSVALASAQFHPDGLILASSGADGAVRLYDLKSCKLAATLKDASGAAGALSSFAFSDNGFHCAAAEAAGVVRLWDLRKLSNFHTLHLSAEDGDKAGAHVSSVSFDASASYLSACVGSRVQVFGAKTWEEVVTLREHKERVTDFRFGSQARTGVSVSLDRNIKLYA